MMGVNGKEVEVIGNKSKTFKCLWRRYYVYGNFNEKRERLLFGEVL